MKLSQYHQEIARAYDALLHDTHMHFGRPQYAFNYRFLF